MRFTTFAAIVVCAVNATVVTGADTRNKAKTVAAAPSVTVTGCLERDDAAFKLRDTSGKQVPQARNWKTAFISKRNSDLDIVDPAKKLKLKDHVGHRVTMTGSLKDTEMRAQSIRHVAASCGQ